jgi:retron-type reverse transcriptase
MVHKRLQSFLSLHNIIYKYQFGFREYYSTSLALTEISDNILQDLENGKFVCGMYFDLSKAFDTVDHKILISKLENYGIRGVPLKWFQNYLTNRKQFTVCNNASSSLNNIEFGVPQGSVLGPLLFLLYTNDIVNCII